jgi:ATP synthase protein I
VQKAKTDNEDSFSKIIAEKEKRKLKAMSENKGTTWFGLGMFGMVGWSVSVPTVIGALGGIWLDRKYPQSFSWTITCLLCGLVAGCLMAWNWVKEDE